MSTYYQRAEQWVERDEGVTPEAIEATIMKFSEKLNATVDEPALTKDIKFTLHYLNEVLAEIQGVEANVKNQCKPEVEAEEYSFDPSSLIPEVETVEITPQEKAAKFEELKSSIGQNPHKPMANRPKL